jgi:hypothetical protein
VNRPPAVRDRTLRTGRACSNDRPSECGVTTMTGIREKQSGHWTRQLRMYCERWWKAWAGGLLFLVMVGSMPGLPIPDAAHPRPVRSRPRPSTPPRSRHSASYSILTRPWSLDRGVATLVHCQCRVFIGSVCFASNLCNPCELVHMCTTRHHNGVIQLTRRGAACPQHGVGYRWSAWQAQQSHSTLGHWVDLIVTRLTITRFVSVSFAGLWINSTTHDFA